MVFFSFGLFFVLFVFFYYLFFSIFYLLAASFPFTKLTPIFFVFLTGTGVYFTLEDDGNLVARNGAETGPAVPLLFSFSSFPFVPFLYFLLVSLHLTLL
jgi:hypothetical protein